MSFIRKVGKFAGGVLFTLSISAIIISIALANITSYDTIKPLASDLIKSQIKIDQQQLSQIYGLLLLQCQTQSEVQLPLGEEEVKLKCSDIRNNKPEDLPNIIVSQFVDSFYYQNFTCDFIDCIKQPNPGPRAMLSSTANSFFNKQIPYAAGAMIIGLIVLLISAQGIGGRLKAIGIPLIFVGLGYFLSQFIGQFVISSLPSQLSSATPVLNSVINSTSNILLTIFAIGIVLTIAGFLFSRSERKSEKKVKKKK